MSFFSSTTIEQGLTLRQARSICPTIVEQRNFVMDARLIWLALGTFAIGVESFAVASLLPQIADSTGVSIATAGYLVIGYSLAYAFGTPILATLAGSLDRRA